MPEARGGTSSLLIMLIMLMLLMMLLVMFAAGAVECTGSGLIEPEQRMRADQGREAAGFADTAHQAEPMQDPGPEPASGQD